MNDPNERSTNTSPSKVEEMELDEFLEDLPKEYQPEILRAVANEPILGKVVMYGIGIEHPGGGFGMTHGPFSNLEMALEVVPGGDDEQVPPRYVADQSLIIRFNVDETADVLYKWSKDRWFLVLVEGVF